MSWLHALFETYSNCIGAIGDPNDKGHQLLPVCHVPQNAQLEVAIDEHGNFQSADVVTGKQTTIVPCTEASGGRVSIKPACHPLCDKLQYVAGDFSEFGGEVTSGFAADPAEPFRDYVSLLSLWCSSPYSHPKARSVLKYVQKKTLVRDLVEVKVLHAGKDGKLLRKWDEAAGKTPEIFKQLKGNSWQADAFVRWIVRADGDPHEYTWTDKALWDSWSGYYLSTRGESDRCFITGEHLAKAEQHPAKIRNSGDRGKLISAPSDPSYLTFSGRFLTPDQACTVGCEVTQKAHNALRWLIAKQGYRNGEQAIVAWAASGAKIPDPMMNTLGLYEDAEMLEEISLSDTTTQQIGKNLSKLLAGYHTKWRDMEKVVVMALDSATPGRIAITYYRELTGSDFLARVLDWHESSAWHQDYGIDPATKRPIRFIGAPSPKDITWAAYGSRADDKLKKATVERLLPTIIEDRRIPWDLVETAVRRAGNPMGLDPWERTKALGIACAVYKNRYRERGYEIMLEPDRCTRDYLFGRLLALADELESWALREAGEKRETNAMRMMQRFANHPCSTWKNVELSLAPYEMRLGARAVKFRNAMDEIHAQFKPEEYVSDRPLSGEFLLGYHCQRHALRPKLQPGDVSTKD